MFDKIYAEQKDLCEKATLALKKEFHTLRSGKVSINILDGIFVDYYGSLTPLNQVATVLATDATTITITPWEKSMIKPIVSALQIANLGINPNNDAECVKLFFPPMTKEEREKSAKNAKAMGEKSKVSIRNIRKDSNDEIKKMQKDSLASEDEIKKAYDEVQKITDAYCDKIDVLVKEKENELLKI